MAAEIVLNSSGTRRIVAARPGWASASEERRTATTTTQRQLVRPVHSFPAHPVTCIYTSLRPRGTEPARTAVAVRRVALHHATIAQNATRELDSVPGLDRRSNPRNRYLARVESWVREARPPVENACLYQGG